MLTTDIAQYLAGDGLGTYGTDVVDTEFPEDLNAGLLVRDYAAGPGTYEHDQNTPVITPARVQIVARDTNVESAYTLAETAYGSLHGIKRTTLNGTSYGTAQALQRPFWLRRDDSGRHYVVFNAEVSIV